MQGCEAKLREEGGKPYVTDNDNYIVDLYFTEPIKDATQAGKEVSKHATGVPGMYLGDRSFRRLKASDGLNILKFV